MQVRGELYEGNMRSGQWGMKYKIRGESSELLHLFYVQIFYNKFTTRFDWIMKNIFYWFHSLQGCYEM